MTRLEILSGRRQDVSVLTAKLANEVYLLESLRQQSDSVKYAIGSMQPIDPEYTKNTYAQGDRVKNQLNEYLPDKCEFAYQGSVTNDTHIKAKSDIDLLVLIEKFFDLEPPQKPKSPYEGSPIEDLLNLRADAIKILKKQFPTADVDEEGSKSIAIEGGSLTRKIDVVPSNWFNTCRYTEEGHAYLRGVQILDKTSKTRIQNTPFLHNHKIDIKDIVVGGGLRKASRLMKSLKYDTETIDLSSYDIVSIAFNMRNEDLLAPKGMELGLVSSCANWCELLLENEDIRGSLFVPDGHRAIFADGHANERGLKQLTRELKRLEYDILAENTRSFKKLSDARMDY